jgi:hypothetical protein
LAFGLGSLVIPVVETATRVYYRRTQGAWPEL